MSDDEQDSGIGGGSQYYQPIIQSSEKADLFEKIRPEATVEEIKMKLIGMEYDKDNKKWYRPKYVKRAFTSFGANEISALMLGVSSKNVAISKLNDAEIRARTKNNHKTYIKLCLSNWLEYGCIYDEKGNEIPCGLTPDQMALGSDLVISNTFITLKQPENAGIRELIKGTTQESRITSHQETKGGMLSGIFRK